MPKRAARRASLFALSVMLTACVSDAGRTNVDAVGPADATPALDAVPGDDTTLGADLDGTNADGAETQTPSDADGAETNVFMGAFEFRPTLAFAIPTEIGIDLRFSAGVATCGALWETLWAQDFSLHVAIDGEGQPIEAGFRREDDDFFAPPDAGDTRVTWSVVALDTSVTAKSYDLVITDRTPTHIAGRLEAQFEVSSFAPHADLTTGYLFGHFDVLICDPNDTPQ